MRRNFTVIALAVLVAIPAGRARALPVPDDADATGPARHGGAPPRGPVPYVILTTRAMEPEFEKLARAHTKDGLRAAVWTLESIRGSYPGGRDDAERIRLFLQDAHAHLGARWLLLGGSHSVIPMRRATLVLNGYFPNAEVQLPTDQYYACLDGTWNADGDDRWGELAGDDVDLIPELNVGRAPVGDREQAKQFVDKTLDDLKRSDTGPRRALLVATEFAGGLVDGAVFAENVRPTLDAQHVTTGRLYENAATWPGAAPETHATLLDSLDREHDLVVMIGAGGWGIFETSGANPSRSPFFTSDEAAALENRRPARYYFQSAFTCFSDSVTSIGEALVNDPHGGGVAVIGPTDVEFVAQSGATARDFLQRGYDGAAATLGEALAQCIAARVVPSDGIRLSIQGLTLLGDPALPFRPVPLATPVAASIEPAVAGDAGDSSEGVGMLTDLAATVPYAERASRPAAALATPRLSLGSAVSRGASSRIALDIPAAMDGATLEIAVLDLSGRRVRLLQRGPAASGPHVVAWDLRSDDGIAVHSGVYFVVARAPGQLVSGRVAVVR